MTMLFSVKTSCLYFENCRFDSFPDPTVVGSVWDWWVHTSVALGMMWRDTDVLYLTEVDIESSDRFAHNQTSQSALGPLKIRLDGFVPYWYPNLQNQI